MAITQATSSVLASNAALNNLNAGTSIAFTKSVSVSGNLTVDTNTLVVDSVNNRVGVGTASPQYILDIGAGDVNVGNGAVLRWGGTFGIQATSGAMRIDGGAQHIRLTSTGDVSRLYVNCSNGNVGIGTTLPASKLHVSDGSSINSNFSTFWTSNDIILSADTSSANAMRLVRASNTPTTRSSLNFIKSRGTLTSPTALQENDLIGDLLFGGYGVGGIGYGGGLFVYADGNAGPGADCPIRLSFVAGSNSQDRQERLTVKSNGNIGIGATSPSERLTVSGNISASGTIIASNYNPASNVATFLATPTSANLAAAVTDETGTGALVFANSPTISSPTISTAITLNATTYTYGTGAADAHRTALSINNVDNTSDLNKPISTATQTALDLKSDISNPVRTTLTGDGSTSVFAISGAGSLTNPSALIVAIDGALQEPSVDYTVSGGNITFTDPLASGAKAVVVSPTNTLQVGELTPSDGSVTSAKLAPNISITNPIILGSIVGPLSLTNQNVSSSDYVINRGLADARYSTHNRRIITDTLGDQTVFEQFIDFEDQYDADLLIANAFGSSSWSVSPAVFADSWNTTNAGVAAFQGQDFYAHNGIFLLRGQTNSNSCLYIGMRRTTSPFPLTNPTREFTCRVFIPSNTEFTTQGYFKIGPIQKGGSGGGEASLGGGLMFNPYIHPTNLVIAANKTGVVSPFTFTTNSANVDFVDTGINFIDLLSKWINITYIIDGTTTPGSPRLKIRIVREGVTLASLDYNIIVDLASITRYFSLYASGASTELGIQYGKFTYTSRSEIFIDYLYSKFSGTSAAPSNWNSLRF